MFEGLLKYVYIYIYISYYIYIYLESAVEWTSGQPTELEIHLVTSREGLDVPAIQIHQNLQRLMPWPSRLVTSPRA